MECNIPLGYEPRCSFYSREQTKGIKQYYIAYYLPNGTRMRRPLNRSLKEAKILFRVKERQLILGTFDQKDQVKMPELLPQDEKTEDLTLEVAIQLYLEVTKPRKSPLTFRYDQLAYAQYLEYFHQWGRFEVKDVQPLDIERLLGLLAAKGLALATLKTAVSRLKKLFNWLIEDAQVVDIKSPIPKKIKLPNRGSLVRDRLATTVEIQLILNLLKANWGSSSTAPVGNIIHFLILTGCRLGEALHAEWSDFDLELGLWNIKHKPKCPTKDGLSWSPKWNKPRTVFLFPEAIELVKALPKVKSTGRVLLRDERGKLIGRETYPAEFIFPKKAKGQFERTDSIKKSWASILLKLGIEDLQIRDLRTYSNHVLRSKLGFSAKEAGVMLGNSEKVNDLHYSPVSTTEMRLKLKGVCFEEVADIS